MSNGDIIPKLTTRLPINTHKKGFAYGGLVVISIWRHGVNWGIGPVAYSECQTCTSRYMCVDFFTNIA